MKRSTLFKSLATLSLTGWLAFAPAQAQHHGQRHGEPMNAETHLARLDARLDLTDAQEAQIEALFERHRAEAQAWREANADATREERLAHAETMMKKHRAAIAEILTAEQLAEFDEMRDNRMHRDRPHSDRPHGDRPHGDRMHGDRPFHQTGHAAMNGLERLDLTEEQRTALRTQAEQRRAAAQAWREANPDATAQEHRAFREQQQAERRADLEQILTPEQLEELGTMRDRAEHRRGDRMHEGRKHDRRGHDGRPAHRAPNAGRAPMAAPMLGRLDLTDEQRAEVRSLMETHREEAAAWRTANPDATPQERQAFRQNHADTLQERLETILTPEQLEQMRTQQNKRGHRM